MNHRARWRSKGDRRPTGTPDVDRYLVLAPQRVVRPPRRYTRTGRQLRVHQAIVERITDFSNSSVAGS
jgi:hypothetical protein